MKEKHNWKKRVIERAEDFHMMVHVSLSLWKADDPEDGVFGKPGDEEDNGGPVFDKINQTRSLHT
jgi:hypothetical protein